MEEKVDLRVYKTRKALVGSLYNLLCEKSYDDITVTELCSQAEVRKATFYKHFGDKNELFSYMIKDMQQKNWDEKVIVSDPNDVRVYYIKVFRFFITFLDENEYMIKKVLASSAKSTLIDLMSEQIELDLRLHIKEDIEKGLIPEGNPALLSASYTGAMVYCAKWWIMEPKRIGKEVVVKQFSDIIDKLISDKTVLN